MKNLILIAILLCVSSYGITKKEKKARRYANRFLAATHTLQGVADETNKDIDFLVRTGIEALHDEGFEDDARMMHFEWKMYRDLLPKLVSSRTKDIGSFKPLSKFLDYWETRIEKLIGFELAKDLRITDLKTFNFGLVEVFAPCSHSQYEFTAHFAGDAHVNPGSTHPYRGIYPITCYYSISIGCGLSTAGLLAILCGPVASIGEWYVDKYSAVPFSIDIYNAFCTKEN